MSVSISQTATATPVKRLSWRAILKAGAVQHEAPARPSVRRLPKLRRKARITRKQSDE